MNVNKQERISLGLGVLVPCYDGECEYMCVQDTPLVGSCTGHRFVNGAVYEVIPHTDIAVTARDTLNEDVLECTPDVLSKHTQLAHAVIYNRAQGLTIKDKTVVLHSAHHFSDVSVYMWASLELPQVSISGLPHRAR
jgi:hypothetical protein